MQAHTTQRITITEKFTKCALCGQGISRKERYCIACKRKMAEANGEPTQEEVKRTYLDTGRLSVEEIKLPRLGERLVAAGLLEPGMLKFALRVQAERREAGEAIRLGQLLVKLNMITPEALDQVAAEQLLQTQEALRQRDREMDKRGQESKLRLKNAMTKMSDLNQLQADFMAFLANELRGPLSLITGYSDMIGDEAMGTLSDEQASAVASMIDAAGRLEKLVDDLAGFSQAAQGALQLQLSPVSLAAPVARALRKVAGLAQRRDVKLEEKLPADLPQVKADEQKLTWVLQELLENAVKCTPAGGLVTVGALARPTYVKLGVIDTGVGMPQERLKDTFLLSPLSNGVLPSQGQGAGLGLALAQRIIEAHGAKLDVRSKEGWGSQFTFKLPVAD